LRESLTIHISPILFLDRAYLGYYTPNIGDEGNNEKIMRKEFRSSKIQRFRVQRLRKPRTVNPEPRTLKR
jgi:hypothetical protein